MGVAAADYDNDGFVDLFLPGVNHNILYRNRGDGTFEEMQTERGRSRRQAVVRRRRLVRLRQRRPPRPVRRQLLRLEPGDGARLRRSPRRAYRTYCHPRFYQGLAEQCSTTTTATARSPMFPTASGIAAHVGKGMGVAFADYDRDGDLDVFVANDTVPNFLFHNDGGREVHRDRTEGRASPSTTTATPSPPWASISAISTTTAATTCSSPR